MQAVFYDAMIQLRTVIPLGDIYDRQYEGVSKQLQNQTDQLHKALMTADAQRLDKSMQNPRFMLRVQEYKALQANPIIFSLITC